MVSGCAWTSRASGWFQKGTGLSCQAPDDPKKGFRGEGDSGFCPGCCLYTRGGAGYQGVEGRIEGVEARGGYCKATDCCNHPPTRSS
jgi:hypothetical protein